MIVDDTPIRRPVPHEQYPDDPTKEGEWIEFRRLPGDVIERARKKKAQEDREDAAGMLRILGPEWIASIREGNDVEKQRVIREIEELNWHVSNFDEPMLRMESIVNWSYDVPVPKDADPATKLDAKTSRWAAVEAITITRPPDEEEEGN